jgi:hypothetical protein
MNVVTFELNGRISSDSLSTEEPSFGPCFQYIDENSNIVLTTDATLYGNSVGDIVLPESVPDRPDILLYRAVGTYIMNGILGESFVRTINIQWENKPSVNYYQIYLIEDSSNSVLTNTERNPDGEINGYTGVPFFTRQSGLLKNNVNDFFFDYTENSQVKKVNVFLFAYNSLGRSLFPLYMTSFISQSRISGVINSIFTEKTSFSAYIGEIKSTNFVDQASNVGGATENTDYKAMQLYVAPDILPDENRA